MDESFNDNDVFFIRGGSRPNSFYSKLIHSHTKGYRKVKRRKHKDFIHVKDFLTAKIIEPVIAKGGKFYNRYPGDDLGVWRIASSNEIIKKLRMVMDKLIDGKESEDDEETSESEDECEEENNKKAETECENDSKETAKTEIIVTASAGVKRKLTDSSENHPTIPNKKIREVPLPLSPKPTVFYLNEKTGHLLNPDSGGGGGNLYHRLLFQTANSTENVWNDKGKIIRFVWDKIISKLQAANCRIVLCPEAQKCIDVDPKALRAFDQNSQTITFRTIRCIIAALTDQEYVTSCNSGMANSSQEQQQKQKERQYPTTVSLGSLASQTSQTESCGSLPNEDFQRTWIASQDALRLARLQAIQVQTALQVQDAQLQRAMQLQNAQTALQMHTAMQAHQTPQLQTAQLAHYLMRERRQQQRSPIQKSPQADPAAGLVHKWAILSWDEHYKKLLEYYLEHGDLRVPLQYEREPMLGCFVCSVRYLWSNTNCLVHLKEIQLRKIGFSWDANAPDPPRSQQEQLALDISILKEYGRTHPDARVPLEDPRFTWLAAWVQTTRDNKIWDEDKLMQELGFEWVSSGNKENSISDDSQRRQQQQETELQTPSVALSNAQEEESELPIPSLPLSNGQQEPLPEQTQSSIQEPSVQVDDDDSLVF